MPKTTKSKFSLNKLNYYAMFDTGDKLDHICVMLEKIVDDLDGQDVVKVEIDNKDNTLVRIFADQERDQLKAENEKLREALKSISWYRQWYVHKPIADKTQIEHDLDVIIKTAEQALEVTK